MMINYQSSTLSELEAKELSPLNKKYMTLKRSDYGLKGVK